MKRWWLLGIFGLLVALHGSAQQVIYANLKELVEDRGDTLSTLKIEALQESDFTDGRC